MRVHRRFHEANIVVVHANRGNVVAQRFAGHRTIVMLDIVAPKLTGFKLYVLSANIVVVPCKRTQHVGPTMLRVLGQQCCVRLHGPLDSRGLFYKRKILLISM